MIRLLKSSCEKAWLFNVKQEEDLLNVGFACFLADCPYQLHFSVAGRDLLVLAPQKAAASPVPTRIINARLSVLS